MAFGGFVDEFSNSPIQPAFSTALELELTGNIQLDWSNFNQNTQYPFSQLVLVTANNSTTNTITLPDATLSSIQNTIIFANASTTNFNVNDFNGNFLFAVSVTATSPTVPAPQWCAFLVDNTATPGPQGNWYFFAFGSGGSSNAASLVGNPGWGLIAQDTLIKTNDYVTPVAASYSPTNNDRGHVLVVTSGSTGTFTLPSTTTTGVGNGYYFHLSNQGNGQISLNPNGTDTINGTSGNFTVDANRSGTVIYDGISNWITEGFASLVPTVVSAVAVALNAATFKVNTIQAAALINRFQAGTYGGSPVSVLYPTTPNQYILWNNTSGPGQNVIVGVGNTGGTAIVGNSYTLQPGEIINVYIAADSSGTANMWIADSKIIAAPGTATNPSIGFIPFGTSNVNLTPEDGWYLGAANQINLSLNGTQRVTYASTGITSNIGLAITGGSPNLSTSGNANLGTSVGSSVSISNAGGSVNIFNATGATGGVSIGNTGTPTSQVNIYGGLMITGSFSLTGPILTAAGFNTAPSYSFTGHTNYGMYFDAGGALGFTAGGAEGFSVGSTQLNYFQNLVANNNTIQILAATGSASNPSYSFAGHANFGMFYDSTVTGIGLAVGGAEILSLNASAAIFTPQIRAPFGIQNAPGLSFQGSVNAFHSGIRFTENGTAPNHEDTLTISVSNDVNLVDFITMDTEYLGVVPTGHTENTLSIFNGGGTNSIVNVFSNDGGIFQCCWNTGVSGTARFLSQGGTFQVGAGTGSGSAGLSIIFGEQGGIGELMTVYCDLATYRTVTMNMPLTLASGGTASGTASPNFWPTLAGQLLTSTGTGNPPTWQAPASANIQSLVTNKNQTLDVVAPFPTNYNVIDFGGGSDNFAVTITPTSTSSKVLVTICANFYAETSTILEVALARNGTIISATTTGQITPTGNASFRLIGNESEEENLYLWALTYLDSPASMAAQIYSLQWRAAAGSGDARAWINITDPSNATQANGISSITAMEIK